MDFKKVAILGGGLLGGSLALGVFLVVSPGLHCGRGFRNCP